MCLLKRLASNNLYHKATCSDYENIKHLAIKEITNQQTDEESKEYNIFEAYNFLYVQSFQWKYHGNLESCHLNLFTIQSRPLFGQFKNQDMACQRFQALLGVLWYYWSDLVSLFLELSDMNGTFAFHDRIGATRRILFQERYNKFWTTPEPVIALDDKRTLKQEPDQQLTGETEVTSTAIHLQGASELEALFLFLFLTSR